MKAVTRFFITVIFLFFCFTGVSFAKSPRWIVYYGSHLLPKDLQGVDIAVLDPDSLPAYAFKDLPTRFFGYLSVGEADSHRKYWPEVAGKNFLVEENSLWKGSFLADIRSKEWRSLILDKIIPEILAKGYKGLFLDTLDTAIELEEKDPVKYAGSKKAMVDFVKEIKKLYPNVLLLPNNALEFLDQYGGLVEGVVVEDLYIPKPPRKELVANETLLDRFKTQFHKPIFNIIYEKSVRVPLAQYAIKRSRKKGYLWYLTTVDLMQLGTLSP